MEEQAERLWCLRAQVGRAASDSGSELVHHRDNERVSGTQETAGEDKIGSFCSIQPSGAAVKLPSQSPEPGTRRERRKSSAFFFKRVPRNACTEKTFSL